MNFLGHFLLAGDNEDLLIGNFIADFVKGKSYLEFSTGIADGIIMHREIDFFTDSHKIFKQSKKRISEKHHHFSGVIIDIFYDHFLARNFIDISGKELEGFAENSYRIIEANRKYLPEPSRHLFSYMRRDNWLSRYQYLDGIEKTLQGMSRRIRHENQLDIAIRDLELHYDDMESDFTHFIDDALSNFKNWGLKDAQRTKD